MNTTALELKADREIVIARSFRAPARLVFAAWTQPEHVSRWWAPKALSVELVSCEGDVRVGGQYRYVTRANGQEFAFSGSYQELTPHSRIVYTQVFEQMAEAGAVVVTVTLREKNGETLLTSHELYPSKEAREAALCSGMEEGLRITMEQLDELVSQLVNANAQHN